jgi:hypothetical protein
MKTTGDRTDTACPVCQAIPLGDPECNLSDRMAQARSERPDGCWHQAIDLALTLLSGAQAKALDTQQPHLATLIISMDAPGDIDNLGQYHAAFVMTCGEAENPEQVHRIGDSAENAAQAVINLLVDMHDEVLVQQSKSQVSH